MRTSDNIFPSLTGESKQIFNIIQKQGPITKNEVALIAGLKLTTLIRFMQPLLEIGLIVESQIGESTGGRKPVLYDVNKNKFYIVGVEISRVYSQIIITNLKMEILDKQRFKMDETSSPEVTVDVVHRLIMDALAKFESDHSVLLGIGVGTVGPLDREKGIIINPLHFEASGWNNVPLKDMLESKHHCYVTIDNGANTAVLAETYFGAGKDLKNVVYFNCGIGIRTGAIASGVLIRTINDSEDVFGHMVIDVDGEECCCGNFGCIECYSSAHAITKKFISEKKKARMTTITKPISEINYIDICTAAEDGDLLARDVLQSAAAILGAGLANFINLLNPELVILSGQLISNSKLFYETCIEIASKKCYLNKKDNIIFSREGFFRENAISLGAAVLTVENLLNSTA